MRCLDLCDVLIETGTGGIQMSEWVGDQEWREVTKLINQVNLFVCSTVKLNTMSLKNFTN